MALENRNTLKSYFRSGSLPSEGHFSDMVDSMVNKIDDGISKTLADGLMLSPIGTSPKLLSFFKSIEEKNPAWSFNINSGSATLSINNPADETVFALTTDGKVGIKKSEPEFDLDVNGMVGMEGRVGTFLKGSYAANGQWHPIITQLNGCHALEIVAGVGKKGRGKYAVAHAIALSTFGKSNQKIALNQASYGGRCSKIEIRWRGTTYDYALEMRTRCDYGDGCIVNYFISRLWTDTYMDESVPK